MALVRVYENGNAKWFGRIRKNKTERSKYSKIANNNHTASSIKGIFAKKNKTIERNKTRTKPTRRQQRVCEKSEYTLNTTATVESRIFNKRIFKKVEICKNCLHLHIAMDNTHISSKRERSLQSSGTHKRTMEHEEKFWLIAQRSKRVHKMHGWYGNFTYQTICHQSLSAKLQNTTDEF